MGTEKNNWKGETVKKSEIIEEYNKFMRGVDRADQILHFYPCCRKTMKWRKKLVLFLLHVAAINSSILFKKFQINQNQSVQAMLSRTLY